MQLTLVAPLNLQSKLKVFVEHMRHLISRLYEALKEINLQISSGPVLPFWHLMG
jgi:hypothetical protein